MAQSEKGVVGMFFGFIFGKKLDPEQVRIELRRKRRELDNEMRKLEVEQQRLGIQMDKVINKGVRAAKQGDAIAKREAARELHNLRAERQDIDIHRASLSKMAFLTRRAIRKLEWSSGENALGVVKKIKEILSDPQLEELLTDTSVRLEDMMEWVDQQSYLAIQETERNADLEESQLGDEEGLFDGLAEAVEKGDAGTAAQLKSKLTGEPLLPEVSDTDEEPY